MLKFISDKIAWRFVVPRARYRRNLAIARKVPEVKCLINRQAFLKGSEYGFYALLSPLLLLVAILYALYWTLERFLQPGRIPLMPPFDDWQCAAVEEAWALVPLDVIRERLGEEVPRILSEKSDL